jgi:cystathionine beta-lyase
MIILCNPHNPVGRVWQKKELTILGRLCLENDILVVSDDIHCDLVYDGFEHVPFASISEEFADRSITCTSASKTFNLPGLKTSNIIIPNPGLREAFSGMLRSCGISSPNIFGIAATEAAYRYGEAWLEQLLDYLQENLAFLEQYASTRIPGLRIIPLQGTYLAWLDFRDCGIDREKLGNFVREDARVALQPGTIFGCREEGFERMNIACPRSTLEEGLRRIEAAVNRLRSY